LEDILPVPPRSSNEPQRIAKLLARAGIASRREIERMIEEGRVAIDGKAVEKPATLLTSLHGVTVDGVAVKAASPTRLYRFHKPSGLLTTERDPAGRPTIYDRLPKDLPRLMPVGRLDMNTEGLLLLTTDGELKRQLELPSSGIERVYRARAFGDVSQEQLEELIHGVEIEGVRYGAIDANLERRTGRNQWIEMRLTEGKNREVRRVLEYLGLQVSRLIRVAYGPFILGDLPGGAVDEVRQHDLIAFRKDPKGAPAIGGSYVAPERKPDRAVPQAPSPSSPRASPPRGRDAPSPRRATGRTEAPRARDGARGPAAGDGRPASGRRARPSHGEAPRGSDADRPKRTRHPEGVERGASRSPEASARPGNARRSGPRRHGRDSDAAAPGEVRRPDGARSVRGPGKTGPRNDGAAGGLTRPRGSHPASGAGGAGRGPRNDGAPPGPGRPRGPGGPRGSRPGSGSGGPGRKR
jgi:23S rRNA pseudouridine2605 synthase